jgi:dienelactone hydrolase
MVLGLIQDNLGAGVDRIVHRFALHRSDRSRKQSRAESLGPTEREEALSILVDQYRRADHVGGPVPFFPAPPDPSPSQRRVRSFGRHGEVVDVAWASDYEPFAPAVRETYLAHEANRTAHARLFLHERPRPVAILVHGYFAGRYAIEERAWPTPWLFQNGLDIALPVLPFHAMRASGRRPVFPSSDPRVTIEGFRQAMHDLGSLVRHLLDRGAPAVGMMGMSLGGYTTALAATVEDALAFAVPFIPLASIADFAAEHGRLVGDEEQQRRQHALLEEVHAVVSPLARPVRVPRAGRLVIGARGDRITPISHARRIAEHFDVPCTEFTGGHIAQLGRADAFRAIGRMLGALSLFEPRRHRS